MGTDYLKLFNKGLCDRIRNGDTEQLAVLLGEHCGHLDEWSIFCHNFADFITPAERIAYLLSGGEREDELKHILASEICSVGERVCLDYFGCFAEVFVVEPKGSIRERDLFSDVTEEQFLLLDADHVETILASLRVHFAELKIMSEKQVATLRDWAEICKSDSDFRVAYFFDY